MLGFFAKHELIIFWQATTEKPLSAVHTTFSGLLLVRVARVELTAS